MKEALGYHNDGTLLQVKSDRRIYLYGPNDPARRYYEIEMLESGSLLILLDIVINDLINDIACSYRVLTELGIGYIIACPILDKFSPYVQLA